MKRRYFLKVFASILIACFFLFCDVFAATKTILYSDLPEAIRYDIRVETDSLDDDLSLKKAEFHVRYIDLNQDYTPEVIVEGASYPFCGMHSCFNAIYQKVSDGNSNGFKRLTTGTGFGFQIGPGRKKGYLDLHERFSLSAFTDYKVTKQWDGKKYIETECLEGKRDPEKNESHVYLYRACKDWPKEYER